MSKYEVTENDTRTFEQRLADLPLVREEEYPEWEAWWNRVWISIENKKSSNKR